MKDRGKREVEAYNNGGGGGDCFDGSFAEFSCKRHPGSSSSTGGICAYCLTDRLVQLVCPECGEQRLPSCSCTTTTTTTELFSSTHDSSSVGRISFLLENEKGNAEISSSRAKTERKSSASVDDFASLKRSNSTCVGRRESKDKFWKIGRLFRKKREKPNNNNNNQINEESYECNGVSRSRSLCSFRGFYDTEESGGFPVSSSSAARASSVSTGNFISDSAKRSCFSESEARISNFDYFDANGFINGPNKNNNIFSLKETEFVSSDDPAYIDLKVHDMSSDSKVPDLAASRRSGFGSSTKEFGFRGSNDHVLGHDHVFRNGGGSCRMSSVTERELRKCRKSYKVWRWFFRQHDHTGSRKNDQDYQNFRS